MIHRTAVRRASRARPATRLSAMPEYCTLMRNLAGQPDSPVIRSLGVTSSRSGEGVSTVALQCAAAAEQVFGQSVLLVEANAARPSLSHKLRLEGGPGFGELLLEAEQREACVQRYSENLCVVTAGKAAAASLPRCSSEAISRTMDSLQEGHRLVVWDLPAVADDDFALEIASQLDGVLLVVEAERVVSDIAQKATDRLRSVGANLLGAVLNKHREHIPQWLAARL